MDATREKLRLFPPHYLTSRPHTFIGAEFAVSLRIVPGPTTTRVDTTPVVPSSMLQQLPFAQTTTTPLPLPRQKRIIGQSRPIHSSSPSPPPPTTDLPPHLVTLILRIQLIGLGSIGLGFRLMNVTLGQLSRTYVPETGILRLLLSVCIPMTPLPLNFRSGSGFSAPLQTRIQHPPLPSATCLQLGPGTPLVGI